MKLKIVVILCCLSVLKASKAFSLVPKQPRALAECTTENCLADAGCYCSSIENPILDDSNPAPQLVAITINDKVTRESHDAYWKPLFFDRVDANKIGLTFYVSHEYTDYSLVNDLYNRGYEIGSYSITENKDLGYWDAAPKQTLQNEFVGQKTILAKFANIPEADIKGVRTPFFELEGDLSIGVYESNFEYDNSWPTKSSEHILPYTLDFTTIQDKDCGNVPVCPQQAHNGFWEVPVTNINNGMTGDNLQDCNYLSSCTIPQNANVNDISNWLFKQIDAVRTDNRAPVTLLLDIEWFKNIPNSFQGFSQFLDRIIDEDDIFLVTVQDILDWVKAPVTAADYKQPDHSGRTASCVNLLCPVTYNGGLRYMESCVPCPKNYPWLTNPEGN